jgi:uncharacterized protein DUF2415
VVWGSPSSQTLIFLVLLELLALLTAAFVVQACRTVKFVRAPLDLLVFAEHVSYVHVVDARTFKV